MLKSRVRIGSKYRPSFCPFIGRSFDMAVSFYFGGIVHLHCHFIKDRQTSRASRSSTTTWHRRPQTPPRLTSSSSSSPPPSSWNTPSGWEKILGHPGPEKGSKPPKPEPVTNVEQLKRSLATLDKLISEFAHNPLFTEASTRDAELFDKVRQSRSFCMCFFRWTPEPCCSL
jgi:hypothetical protein